LFKRLNVCNEFKKPIPLLITSTQKRKVLDAVSLEEIKTDFHEKNLRSRNGTKAASFKVRNVWQEDIFKLN
jgi:hypothetical protein